MASTLSPVRPVRAASGTHSLRAQGHVPWAPPRHAGTHTSWAASPLRSHTSQTPGSGVNVPGTKDPQGRILDSSTHEENQAQPLLVWELISILRNQQTKANQKSNKDPLLGHHGDGGH